MPLQAQVASHRIQLLQSLQRHADHTYIQVNAKVSYKGKQNVHVILIITAVLQNFQQNLSSSSLEDVASSIIKNFQLLLEGINMH